ncbi:MAG: N-acetylmuramoyl-L-alanine amidase [Bacteroidetes bacterium]|nr:N-acetylmuramoyl-L-alanine amidase [Bacteroidota bacterium]
MDTVSFRSPGKSNVLNDIDYHKNLDGIGLDLFLNQNIFLEGSIYPDQNSNDILLGLEFTENEKLEELTAKTEFIYWYEFEQSTTTEISYNENGPFIPLRDDDKFDVIVLDAGHGGRDPGTVNKRLGLMEKDIALAVVKKVGEYMNRYLPEVEVIYTREDDRYVGLEERGLIATRNKADLFVSIHVNAARNHRAYGAEVFFLGMARSESALNVMKRENSIAAMEGGNEKTHLTEEELLIYELANAGNMAVSERIAAMMEDQFRNRAQRRSRGIKQAGFMVLWHATTAAVLVELGFLSNPNEARYLNSEYGQTIMASAIFRSIRDFVVEYNKSMNTTSTASNE